VELKPSNLVTSKPSPPLPHHYPISKPKPVQMDLKPSPMPQPIPKSSPSHVNYTQILHRPQQIPQSRFQPPVNTDMIYNNQNTDAMYGNEDTGAMYGNEDIGAMYGNEDTGSMYSNEDTSAIKGNHGSGLKPVYPAKLHNQGFKMQENLITEMKKNFGSKL